MRFRGLVCVLLASLGVATTLPPSSAQAQFNPFGRKKERKPARPAAPARPARPLAPARPAAPAPAAPQKTRSTEALIARYTGIVLAQPGAAFPLQRLAELYRERDGNLDALLADFERRAAGGDGRFNALVALAGLYKQDGQLERAIATYERAIGEQPSNPTPLTALAHLLLDRGDKAAARQRFQAALPLLKNDAEREQVLRLLMQLALDEKDFAAAQRHHAELVRRAGGSPFVRAELGRELMLRGEHARAVDAFREVVRAATGDNRVLAPALRDLGKALAKAGDRKQAIVELRRALRLAGAQAGIRREIYEVIVEVYRADERLPELIAELERDKVQDYDRLRLLAGLYEETGKIDRALETYEQALAKNPRDVDTRIRVVQLLQIQGELDRAISQYEKLIEAAPHNPDFVFQLSEALLQRGERDQALEHLKKLEARSGKEEETLAALVDFYERMGEKDRAVALLQRLTQMGSRDARHLVELGERYWEQGDKQKALTTWERIKTQGSDRAEALHTLGEVYLQHDLPKEALEALREAMKLRPNGLKYKKAYALALERTGAASSRATRDRQYEEARKIWEELLASAGNNQHLAREARQHIVTLYSLSGQLTQRLAPLARQLEKKPPDLNAGRLLSEAQIRLRRYKDAERTLQTIIEHAPGDVPSLQQLERVSVQQRKLDQAMAVLHKLVRADPKRAREYYQRLAEYSAELYRDDDALKYAARAVDLSPDDAEGHRKLGEMYRRRQQPQKAIGAFRQAIVKNDRLFAVYFDLAELLLNEGQSDEADRLLRRVLRASPDEELVAQAARLSMQINLGKGSLDSLEKDLLPLSLGNPNKPMYRRLLVEIYGALAFPWVHQSRSPDAEQAQRARQALRQLGERAVKPLLDALGDERDTQQRIALELLAHIENKSAGPALFQFATSGASTDLRVRAMIAAGSLADPALLPRLQEMLVQGGEPSSDESDPVTVAAAWSLAKLTSPRAVPLLTKLLESDAPSIRGLAALGLGRLKERRAAPALLRVAEAPEAGHLPRACAAHALGELGAADAGALRVLAQLAEATDPLLRSTAVLALSRLKAEAAPPAIAAALVSPNASLRLSGSAAAAVWSTGEYRALGEPLRAPLDRVDVRRLLEDLRPEGYRPEETARALVALSDSLKAASVAAVQSSPERARVVADALLAGGGKPAFAPLMTDPNALEPALRQSASDATAGIAAAVTEPFLALASHPSPEVRARAVRFLSTRPSRRARAAALEALKDRDESVQRAALSALSASGDEAAIPAVAGLLAAPTPWPLRARAAETLGRLAQGSRHPAARKPLATAAEADPFALVREAALLALWQVDAALARPIAERTASSDPEPRLRKTAERLLASGGKSAR